MSALRLVQDHSEYHQRGLHLEFALGSKPELRWLRSKHICDHHQKSSAKAGLPVGGRCSGADSESGHLAATIRSSSKPAHIIQVRSVAARNGTAKFDWPEAAHLSTKPHQSMMRKCTNNHLAPSDLGGMWSSPLVKAECCRAFSTGFAAVLPRKDAKARHTRLRVECGQDHLVDEAPFGRDKRVGKPVFIVLRVLAIFSASPRSARWMISVAPLAPITAISAVGHA